MYEVIYEVFAWLEPIELWRDYIMCWIQKIHAPSY
jgi:hypothetical protein